MRKGELLEPPTDLAPPARIRLEVFAKFVPVKDKDGKQFSVLTLAP